MFGFFKKRAKVRQIQSDRNLLIEWINQAFSDTAHVTPQVAQTCVPFFASLNFLATSVANLPLHMYRRTPDGGKERITDGMATTVGRFWNPDMSAYDGLDWTVRQACLHGAAYVRIYRSQRGDVVNLYPLEEANMEVGRANGQKYYLYHPGERGVVPSGGFPSGGREDIPPRDILDIPFALDDNLLDVVSPVERCKSAIALALALERYASSFFRSGGIPPILVKREHMTPEAATRFNQDMNRALKGAQERGDLMSSIPDTTEIVPTTVANPTSAQMIESRRFATEEISRVLGVPPILINDLSKGTYNNTEQQDSQFVKHTLSKWARKLESQMNLKFFGPNSNRFVEFDLKAVERGLFRERIEGLARQIQSGMITPNEARATENMPPAADENADKLFMQGATMPLEISGQMDTEPEPTEPGTPTGDGNG